MAKFVLDPADVQLGEGTKRHSGGRGRARDSRANQITKAHISLRHVPTGVEVHGDVPPGHYSRKEMRQRWQALYDSLYKELERAAARALRIPGQR